MNRYELMGSVVCVALMIIALCMFIIAANIRTQRLMEYWDHQAVLCGEGPYYFDESQGQCVQVEYTKNLEA